MDAFTLLSWSSLPLMYARLYPNVSHRCSEMVGPQIKEAEEAFTLEMTDLRLERGRSIQLRLIYGYSALLLYGPMRDAMQMLGIKPNDEHEFFLLTDDLASWEVCSCRRP